MKSFIALVLVLVLVLDLASAVAGTNPIVASPWDITTNPATAAAGLGVLQLSNNLSELTATKILARSNLDAMGAAKYNTGFWDDFQRANVSDPQALIASGGPALGYAPSISPVTGTNYLWGILGGVQSWGTQILNGEYIDAGGTNAGSGPYGCYPTTDLGFRPTYMAAWIKWVNLPGHTGPYQEMCFISSPNNSLQQALHVTMFPQTQTLNVGLWSNNVLTYAVYNYTDPTWPGIGGYGVQAANQITKVAIRIEGSVLSIDWGGDVLGSWNIPNLSYYGGRYFCPEIFYVGDTNAQNQIHILRVEARANEYTQAVRMFSSAIVTNGLTVTNGTTTDTLTVTGPTTNALAFFNQGGVVSSATIGTGLSLSSGVLNASSSGASLTANQTFSGSNIFTQPVQLQAGAPGSAQPWSAGFMGYNWPATTNGWMMGAVPGVYASVAPTTEVSARSALPWTNVVPQFITLWRGGGAPTAGTWQLVPWTNGVKSTAGVFTVVWDGVKVLQTVPWTGSPLYMPFAGGTNYNYLSWQMSNSVGSSSTSINAQVVGYGQGTN